MINISTSKKENSKENDQNLSNSNIQEKSISASLISDTSPVYLFCTSKNGINSKNENGWTPIYRSIIANNLIALNELLNLGSDPNISNNLGETPLYLCVDIDNYDALIILLQYNADTNIAKRNGTTPLHLATKKNKDNFMHALLRNKANPNLPNKLYSQTPTHLAIINKINEEMLNIFHEYNADIYNIKDKYEKTPFDYAKELKDEEYLNMVVNIFGDKNNEIKTKLSKTINVNIQNKNDNIIIPQNLHFHNSNYNLIPEKITIENEEKQNIIETKEEDYKLEENKLVENDDNNIFENKNDIDKGNVIGNNNIIESNKKSENNEFLNFDNLYSDRSIFKNSNNSKSKKQNSSSDNKSNKKNNNMNDNKLSEFKPVISVTEQNEIKQKNSLIKTFKSKINIDTKMIDNSKDIVLLNHNDNNYTNNLNLIKNQTKKEEIENNNVINDNENDNDNDIDNENEIENNIIGVNESNDENKRKSDTNDKEIIKNIISSTVKKIKVNSNTCISEYSSLNNNSINKNNVNSNSKTDDLKLFSNSNKSNTNNENKQSGITNLENFISTNNLLENGTSSFILYNSKKHVVQNDTTNNINNDNDNDIESNNNINNSISTNNKISDITPISTKKMNNDITPTVNSNIFSEMQFNTLNSNQNNYNQTELDISNKDIKVQTEEKISRSNKKEYNSNNKENKANNDIQIISNSDNNLYDGSLEYSKSKSNIVVNNQNLSIQSKNNSLNSPYLNNTNSTNNNVNLQHHRQISYHKNSNSSINKRRKEEEAQIEDSYNNNSSSNNKENDTPNNKEIIYYTKNYLKGNENISTKKDNQFKNPKTEVVHNNIIRNHNLSESNINSNNMDVQRYNSLTNKTNSINQKIFTYTSPNINKNTYILEANMNNNAEMKTNPNVNLSNLNGTKEEFFSNNNNNLSSFLNTNKKEQNNKDNSSLRESKNNDNSTFNVYDDVMEVKNLGKKTNIYTTNNQNTINNTNNKKKNDNKMRTYRGSSMGNTTLASLSKNINNTGKQSINSAMAKSITNNNYNTNSSNLILTGRNSNTNNNNLNTSDNLIKNIPINTLLRLRDWLISCDLLCYYNLLIENNMYDIDKCISDLQNNKINISYKDIEDIGIRKPGHIFRLLLKLEIDSGILDNNLFNYILSKFNMSSSISNNIILTSSITDINCCGICNKNKNYQSYIKRNDCPYNDIFSFLKYKDLWKYKENFLHNGFDQLEYVLLQLFSKYTYDKEIMNDCFHIYIDKDKKNVLNKLYEEKKCIALEVGMETDDNEINQVLSNYSYSSKYSNKKNNHNNEQKKSGEENCCNIF